MYGCKIKISHEQRCYKIYELALAFVKFSVLNLTANLKDEIVKFKKANPALFQPNSPLFFKKTPPTGQIRKQI